MAKKSYTIRLGFLGSYEDYVECELAKEKGIFLGIDASLLYKNFLTFSLRVSSINSEVERINLGSDESEGTKPKRLTDINIWAGLELTPFNFSLTPYIGVGYRTMDVKMRVTYFTWYTYSEFQKPISHGEYFYIPLGIKVSYRMGNWEFGVGGEYNSFLFGNSIVYSDTYGEIRMHQKNGYGFRYSFMIKKEFNFGNLLLVPLYKHWNIDKSDIFKTGEGDLYIPKNRTHEFGISIMYEN